MSTYQDYSGEPAADQGTPYAQRQRIAAGLRQMPAVDHNGDPVSATPATTTTSAFDAIGTADPATALAVLKAADALGVGRDTVNTLLDSAAFVNTVTGAAPDEIAAAISARVTPPMRMKPNPSQGHSGDPTPARQPQTFRDRIRATLGHSNTETNLGPRAF